MPNATRMNPLAEFGKGGTRLGLQIARSTGDNFFQNLTRTEFIANRDEFLCQRQFGFQRVFQTSATATTSTASRRGGATGGIITQLFKRGYICLLPPIYLP